MRVCGEDAVVGRDDGFGDVFSGETSADDRVAGIKDQGGDLV